jgi:hypothetical protein
MLIPKDILDDLLRHARGSPVSDALATTVFSDHVEAYLSALITKLLPETPDMSPGNDISEELLMRDLGLGTSGDVSITADDVRRVLNDIRANS